MASIQSPSLQNPPTSGTVRFTTTAIDEEQEARLRRGTVSPDLKNMIAMRGILGRKGQSEGSLESSVI